MKQIQVTATGVYFLFQGHVWQYRDHFAGVSRQETDVLPKFSCIKSVVTYLLDT